MSVGRRKRSVNGAGTAWVPQMAVRSYVRMCVGVGTVSMEDCLSHNEIIADGLDNG